VFDDLNGIAVYEEKVYVIDGDCVKVIHENQVVKVAGGRRGYSDGGGSNAKFNRPCGLAVFDGIVYVADTKNHAIRKIVYQEIK
jgi:hypothetical protein